MARVDVPVRLIVALLYSTGTIDSISCRTVGSDSWHLLMSQYAAKQRADFIAYETGGTRCPGEIAQ
jgi:hypothetical protein